MSRLERKRVEYEKLGGWFLGRLLPALYILFRKGHDIRWVEERGAVHAHRGTSAKIREVRNADSYQIRSSQDQLGTCSR
ncbi:hypothetical protein CVT26_002919 [Gymnopilus dilepis]|uniref:Uncharacterized protein n=1 Tax=Gymnopilus dilepis TaxID=231916 RepID=A0A409W2I3_9AGAR|nr:hypothetical protein CVT26_002919 [Gymnopilus dilepis]